MTKVSGRLPVLDDKFAKSDEADFLNLHKGMPEEQYLDTYEVYMLDAGHYIVISYVSN